MAGILSEQSFFHGSLSRSHTDELLTNSAGNGSFLIRTSTSSPGNYVLSLSHNKQVLHFQIKNHGECWYAIDDGPLFEGLDDLVEHYSHLPDGLPCALGSHIPVGPPRCSLNDGSNNLHTAATLGNAGNVSKYMKTISPTSKNSLGRTPLHECCRRNHIDSVLRLLSRPTVPEINEPDVKGWTALHFAAAAGNTKILQLLLKHGASVRILTSDSETPRQIAARLGNSDACRVLSDMEDGNPLDRINAMLQLLWYHGKLSRAAAENVMSIYGLADGLFLVRYSSSTGNFILTMCFDQTAFHFQIQHNARESFYFIDDGPGFQSLVDLIQYYSSRADGLPCVLTMYCMRSRKGPGLTGDTSAVYATGNLDVSAPKEEPVRPSQYEAPSVVGSQQSEPPHLVQAMAEKTRLGSESGLNVIKYCNLSLSGELGAGEFGAVFGGILQQPDGSSLQIAVKTIKPERMSNKEDFLREARLMSSLKHPNIVQLLGIVEEPSLMIVQELVPNGSLENYFKNHPKSSLTDFQRILWASQIANGMAYLEKVKFVHRDLATRNILLDDRLFAKISDFGLSRAYEDNYYQASTGGRWPVRWYAPESINYGKFTSRSDVWSFGITLWEIWSHGAMPYDNMSGPEVVEFLANDGRLAKPRKCPAKVSEIMNDCWLDKYQERPTFASLLRRLTALLRSKT
eukprot:gene5348-7101_t